jgi:hypothetical protein
MDPELEDFLRGTLSSPAVVADHSWHDGLRPLVLEVRDRTGRSWVVKRYADADLYFSELIAYRRWVPALEDRAPELRASDDNLHSLVLTALPGKTPERWQDSDVQHQAGRLLRRFHDAESFPPDDDANARMLYRLDRVAPEARKLLAPGVIDFVRGEINALDRITAPPQVSCHLDYSPRNWLVEHGHLRIIDFGDAAPDTWIADFGRLFVGWRLSPSGKEAFLAGYGRMPTADDLALLRTSYATTLIAHVVVARERGYANYEAACQVLLDGLMSGEIA